MGYKLAIRVVFDLSGTKAEQSENVCNALTQARDAILFGATSVQIGSIVWDTTGMWSHYFRSNDSRLPNGFGVDYEAFAEHVEETLGFLADSVLVGHAWNGVTCKFGHEWRNVS